MIWSEDAHVQTYIQACEDLLHASTSPQVETARTYELAKCRGNEGWPPSPAAGLSTVKQSR